MDFTFFFFFFQKPLFQQTLTWNLIVLEVVFLASVGLGLGLGFDFILAVLLLLFVVLTGLTEQRLKSPLSRGGTGGRENLQARTLSRIYQGDCERQKFTHPDARWRAEA